MKGSLSVLNMFVRGFKKYASFPSNKLLTPEQPLSTYTVVNNRDTTPVTEKVHTSLKIKNPRVVSNKTYTSLGEKFVAPLALQTSEKLLKPSSVKNKRYSTSGKKPLSGWPQWAKNPDNTSPYDVIIIGNGLVGAWTAKHFQDIGVTYQVLDPEGIDSLLPSSAGQSRISKLGGGVSEPAEHDKWTKESTALYKALEDKKKHGEIILPTPILSVIPEGSPAQKIMLDRNPYACTLSHQDMASIGISVKEGYVGVCDGLMDAKGNQVLTTSKYIVSKVRQEIPKDSLTFTSSVINPQQARQNLAKRSEHSVIRDSVGGWHSKDGVVRVITKEGKVLQARSLVLATNAWSRETLEMGNIPKETLAPLQSTLSAGRAPLYFFTYPKEWPDDGVIVRIPDPDTGHGNLYMMKEGGSLKVGQHHIPPEDRVPHPSAVDRTVSQEAANDIGRQLKEVLGVKEPFFIEGKVCMYGLTQPFEKGGISNAVIGPIPGLGNVVVGSNLNGNGAKVAPALARILAQLACLSLKTPDIEVVEKLFSEIGNFLPSKHIQHVQETQEKEEVSERKWQASIVSAKRAR